MITLKVTTFDGRPLAEPFAAQFGEAGGTIGRAPDNALVLADRDRSISRVHATVFARDGRFRIRDQGSASPTFVNGRPVGNGRDVALGDGDEVRIGRYAIAVEDADARASAIDATATGTLPPGAVLSWSERGEAPSHGISTFIVPEPAVAPPSAPSPAVVPAPAQPAIDRAATLPLRTTAGSVSESSDEALLAAFLAGAGIAGQPIAEGLSPELAYTLGRLLREATQGVLDLLLARAAAKREVRAEVTVIVAQDNNPLKFAPGADAALAAVLTPRGRGFMPPVPAVRDAYESLATHHQGFIAGMRAALDVVLARFDPAEFEARLPQPGMADSLLPMNRKAKLWDLFTRHYGELAEQANVDFNALFGPEFLRAYDAQVARLRDAGARA
jgi:predicted component of type VI protein secretion system